jgi:transcriptional regulator with PAS, ATPase and Fis domain
MGLSACYVVLGVDQGSLLQTLVGASLPLLLQQLDQAVLVIDRDRNLRFMNDRARQLLGYDEDQEISGRCRNTTRGTDCLGACPLTYALESDLDRIEDFSTVYRTRDDRPVPLRVTVVPLRTAEGELTGSVEILRPAEADPGFFLCGRSEAAGRLRRRLAELARTGGHIGIIGPPPVLPDVARAVHRLSGVCDDLLHAWDGSWSRLPEWPPGTLLLRCCDVEAALPARQGWRLIISAPDTTAADEVGLEPMTWVELPSVDELGPDLPFIVAAWVRRLGPHVQPTPGAVERLCSLARERGLVQLERVLTRAVAAVGEGELGEAVIEVEDEDPDRGFAVAVEDEVLASDRPLLALERCLLREILTQCEWRMQEAADRLGISRVTLWRKLRDHGIERCGRE